jgi:hypothetical protein
MAPMIFAYSPQMGQSAYRLVSRSTSRVGIMRV